MAGKIFHFDEEFQLGIIEIDTQHRNLVDVLNEIHQLVADGNRQQAKEHFTNSLTKYVVDHFSQEEHFMEKINYPQVNEHKQVHANFRKNMENLLPLISEGNDTAFRSGLTDVYAWIINHIGKTDRKYAEYYSQNLQR